mmetsp:Transcript_20906/g.45517  ORF Transcript_20906/g.45517 Transcript_20906/m.45517 type:complete len:222 (+) Transcript_20906:491-1156(+)
MSNTTVCQPSARLGCAVSEPKYTTKSRKIQLRPFTGSSTKSARAGSSTRVSSRVLLNSMKAWAWAPWMHTIGIWNNPFSNLPGRIMPESVRTGSTIQRQTISSKQKMRLKKNESGLRTTSMLLRNQRFLRLWRKRSWKRLKQICCKRSRLDVGPSCKTTNRKIFNECSVSFRDLKMDSTPWPTFCRALSQKREKKLSIAVKPGLTAVRRTRMMTLNLSSQS